eukprot:7159790-Karenia_brevis.AAC.1
MEKDKGRQDVIALRGKGEVWVRSEKGSERVAKWNGQEMKLRGEAKELEARINSLLAETRRPEKQDSLSE